MTRPSNSRAFTLVELLIVIAVLALLAGLALVNFQHAQARAKIARVHSDMRTLHLALEAYRTDQRAYPPAYIGGGDIMLAQPLAPLTTPVAYISSIPTDPFGEATYDFNPGLTQTGYCYRDAATTSIGMASQTFGYIWQETPDKKYFTHSCGPNRIWDVMPYIEYDPTNGVVSEGDITRFGP